MTKRKRGSEVKRTVYKYIVAGPKIYTRRTLQYWNKKFTDPTFHPDTHGGARNFRYSIEEEGLIKLLLWY